MSKRDDIIASALAIISEQGISALTLPALFAHAHTGAGTFYHYFENRAALVEGVFAYCHQVVEEGLQDVQDQGGFSVEEWFSQVVRRLFEIHRERPQEMEFLYAIYFAHVMPKRETHRTIPCAVLLNKVIIAAQQQGLANAAVDSRVYARAVRSVLATIFLGSEWQEYSISEKSMDRFVAACWAVLQTYE
ncbi:MAG: TetR/AcrR family transcriptional regulator [Coriobacteriia bacterium]|nr:TetR/AcrR family transcriptional regulator [Coriobacteriia bacterium]